ncbi:hypothetical protein FLM48_22550 [Shewanella sp. Scap07]|uniref:hypothetical protein n=1 Tax=Shewanella sp. Scap07 TaxID=2589987 RepID=UPI0015B961DA|nr:hypothetical protein [Shewanella sp. Scap07]QLE87611.1 hypothetical protein FLM48_22550 [Shewanella sp. Scap07]
MQEIDCNEPGVVRVGLRTVLNIMKKWNCNEQQIRGLLKLPANYDALDFEQMSFSRDQIERVSYILNIHAGLRSTFSNPENVYGFMSMVNHSSPFNGISPIDFVCNGEVEQFKLLLEYLDRLFEGR